MLVAPEEEISVDTAKLLFGLYSAGGLGSIYDHKHNDFQKTLT